jgi:protein-tyrosine phosphatase
MECFLVPDIVERIRAGEVLTLAGSRYLVLELPFDLLPVYTNEVLFQISLTGLVPVLVHPERNAQMACHLDRLRPLVECGTLVLMNSGSLTGAFGRRVRKAAEGMLRQGLVHGIATDAHNTSTRPALITPAIEAAVSIIGEKAARRLAVDLAEHVWENLEYETPELPAGEKRGWLK